MTDAQLSHLRQIHADMQTEPTNWEWIGAHASQRMFSITETRAKQYAKNHGGTAREMPATDSLRATRCAAHNVRYCREGC